MKNYILATLLLFMGLVNGYSQTDAKPDRKVPVLNGHTFPSIGYFKSSFINTSLQADIGFGSTSVLQIPGIIIDDIEILDFEGKLLFVDINVQYQQRFTPWLALFMNINLAGRVGTDMSTILADGVNTITGGDIGWLVRITQSKKFNLSGSLNVKNLSGSFLNVTDYFSDLINNVPNPSVIKKVPAMIVGIGARGAYAFNPTFGLQFHTQFSYGESFERTQSQGYFTLGVLGDVDFKPIQNIPVGLSLGYTLTSAPEIVMSQGGVSNLFTGKIGYTGSNDFELGLQFSYYDVELESVKDNPYLTKVMLTLKFYF